MSTTMPDERVRMLDHLCALASAMKADAISTAHRAGLDPITIARVSCTPIGEVELIIAEAVADAYA